MKILIVEDEESIALGLKFNFEQEGYDVVSTGDGPTALSKFDSAEEPFDLVILDLMLPCMSGYEACREIRSRDPHIPILVLSARTLSEDKALAFDCGSDQYMTKPFALPELLSRVRNLLNRRNQQTTEGSREGSSAKSSEVFEFGNALVDFEKFQVTVGTVRHELTTKEMELLRYFIEHEGAVLSRAQILRDVWDESPDIATRSIDNFVMRLRKIVEKDPANPEHILSVRGTGYRFVKKNDVASN
ncbi:MAG: response regulator transcription factor [Planctomycetaceae bacterium]